MSQAPDWITRGFDNPARRAGRKHRNDADTQLKQILRYLRSANPIVVNDLNTALIEIPIDAGLTPTERINPVVPPQQPTASRLYGFLQTNYNFGDVEFEDRTINTFTLRAVYLWDFTTASNIFKIFRVMVAPEITLGTSLYNETLFRSAATGTNYTDFLALISAGANPIQGWARPKTGRIDEIFGITNKRHGNKVANPGTNFRSDSAGTSWSESSNGEIVWGFGSNWVTIQPRASGQNLGPSFTLKPYANILQTDRARLQATIYNSDTDPGDTQAVLPTGTTSLRVTQPPYTNALGTIDLVAP